MGKYEEALERAKELHEAGNALTKSQMEIVFPELKESEDERIRKWLIEMVEELRKANPTNAEHNGNCSEAIAYLERQKDQKPVEGTALQKAFINSKSYTLEEKCDASDYAEAILPTSVTYGENEEEYKLHKIIEAAFIAGQKKEQKPAEKQDYSDLNDFERAIHRGFLSAGVENVPVAIIKETAQECLAQMKPAEWSEEDEDMRDTIIRDLKRLGGDIVNVKPAYKAEIDWLKSLRPQPRWKPSEEQIEALKYTLGNGGFYNKKALDSLLSDLQKLL